MIDQSVEKKERWLERLQNTKRYYFFQRWADKSGREKISVKEFLRWIGNDIAYLIKWNINLILQLKEYGGLVREKSGLSYFEQWKRMWYLVFVLRTDSSELRYMQLFQDDRWKNVDLFSYARHNIIERQLDGFRPKHDVKQLSNKFNFYKRCKENGWNTPEIHAIYENGVCSYPGEHGFELQGKNLFLKNLNDSGGKNAKYLLYQDGSYRDFKGNEFSPAGLTQYLQKQSKNSGGLLVQEAKTNHPKWKKFGNGALCTCRIVTGRSLKNKDEIIPFFGSLKMTTDTNEVDNYVSGGLVSAIDVKTGVLHQAVGSKVYKGDIYWDFHPDTGERITGTKLFMWEELLAFSKELHSKFKTLSIGWDLTITEEGLCVIEGNTLWSAKIVETPGNKPLYMTDYPIWVEECVELLSEKSSRKTLANG